MLSNKCLNSTHCILLNLAVDPPTITVQPMSMEVGQGGSVTFTVTATSEDGVLNYQWRLDGIANTGATLNTLNLTNVTEATDEGTYTVELANSQLSTISDGAVLSVGKYLQFLLICLYVYLTYFYGGKI